MYEKYIYPEIVNQCRLKKWSMARLSEETMICLPSLREKMNGRRHFYLDEVITIHKVLNCGLPVEELFKKKQ